jgi:hypothetical protein
MDWLIGSELENNDMANKKEVLLKLATPGYFMFGKVPAP